MPVLSKEEIKSMISITDIFNRYKVKINNKGFANCVFHSEKSASLKVYENSNTYYCFGCGINGDIFSFVQYMENCGFREAFKLLSGNEDGCKPHKPKPTEEQRKQKHREQICNEWKRCLDFIRDNALVIDIDLSVLNERALNNLCNLNPEYIKKIHRLPYLDYLVFEGGLMHRHGN